MRRSRGNILAIFIGAFVVLAAPLGSALVHRAIGHTRPDSIEEYSAAPDLGTSSADLFLDSGKRGFFLSPLHAAQVASNAAAQDVVINEFLAAPSATVAGDANGDGVGNATDDEFVELINTTSAPLDISGYTISDSGGVTHTFTSGTVVPAGEAVVVFGGGTPTGAFGNATANGNVFVANASGHTLSLNNSGDTITVKNGSGTTVDTLVYTSSGALSNESSNRNPDSTGANFIRHTSVTGAAGRTYSPGTKVDGTRFTTPPSVTTLSPSAVAPNSGQFSLSITGTNFDSTATAKVGGTAVTTVFNDGTSLTATTPNSLITAVSNTVAVQVTNGQGNRSNIVNLITGPQLDSISPSSIEVNSGPFTLTANGSGFSSGAIVRVESTDLTPTSSSNTQLQVTVPNSLIASLGNLSVKVINSNGGPSVAKTLAVTTAPPPSVSAVNPASIQQGSANTSIAVTGSAFKDGAVVSSDGVSLQTSFTDSSHLSATMTAAILAIAGPKEISVTNPDNQVSGSVTLNVFLVPAVSNTSPAAVDKGSADFTLTVNGSSIQDGAHVKFDASDLGGTFINSGQVQALVPAALVTAAGAHTIKIFNPGSPDSNGVQFLVQEPAPIITSISPVSTIADSGDFTLTVNGSNYQSGAKVNFAGTELSPATTTSTKLTAVVTNNLIQGAGNKVVFVKNPDSRTSGNQNFIIEERGTRAVVINEFLADPPGAAAGDLQGDANGDGVRSAGDDELVELVNQSGVPVNIGGWTIWDATQVRHLFAAGTVVPAGEAVVVFGGGTPTGTFGNAAANGLVFSASTGTLSLGNSGDTIELKDGSNQRIDVVSYGASFGGGNQSGNLNPDGSGNVYALHSTIAGSGGALFSPGKAVNQSSFTTAPAISSLSPAGVAPNSGQFLLTINGTGFDTTASAKAASTAVTTTFNSSTSLTATIPNSLITAVSNTVAVQVTNGQGNRSNIVNLITGPQLDSISPGTVEVNSGALELTLNGQGFSAGAIVKVAGSDLTPSANTPTQLKATVPGSLLSSLGDLSVKVINSNGGPSIAKTLSVTTTPPPSVTAVDPSGIQRGSGDTVITVLGSAFKNGAVVRSDGVALQTSFADSTHVTATMTAAILAIAGPKEISVTNPDNQVSGSVTLNVFLVPSISALSPPIADKGGGDLLLTIAGSNFQDGVRAKFDTAEMATSFVSSTEIRATLPAALVAIAGLHTVTARNPGSPDSNGLTFLIQEPAPSISSLAPGSIVADSGDFTLTIHGSNFQSGAAVDFGGAVLTPSSASASQLAVLIGNSLIQNAGSKSVFVKNPDGRVSVALSFSVLDRGTRAVVINEFLAAPPGSAPGDLQGDANGDGSRSASQDEFVEIVNRGGAPVDISGWTLSDATTARHTFAPGTILPGGEAAVVFGGGTPAGAFGNAAQNGMIFKASSGSLSLGNSSDTIELKNATGQRIDIVVYTSTLGDNNQSANLNPDASGSSFALHSSVAGASGALFSPGTRVSGQPFTAVPSLQRLDPDTIEAGPESFLLRVIGSGFSPSDTVTFSGERIPTTFVSASELLATVSGTARSIPGAHTVRVVTVLGSRTLPLTFPIFVQPVIARLVPSTLFRGAGSSVLEVQGAGFVAGSRVQISALGGADAFSDLPSTFVSESALRATVDGGLLLETGLRAVRVVTPEARVSNQVFLSITLRPPVLDSVSPSRTFAGHPTISLLLAGNDFQPGAIVKFDLESLASSVVSDREMVAVLPASFLVADASHAVRVVNPDGQTSRSVPFVVSPLPVIDRIEPSSVRAGRRSASLTVLGSRFQADATVRVEGEEIVPASSSSSSIVVNLPEKFIRVPGRLSLKVVNGDGGESAEVQVPVVAPVLPAVIINEILADPPAGADVNGDGSASTSEDEFVEIVNTTNAPVSIGGYTISDATGIRHVFALGTLLPAGESAIVFGGGNPTGSFGSAGNNGLVFKASTGTLSLNNTEETVTLRDVAGNLLSQVAYGSEGGNDQSLTLDPDVTGDLVQHTTSPDASVARFSPGTRVDGRPFTIAPFLQSITPGRIEVREEITLTLSGQAFERGARMMLGASVIDPEFVDSTVLRFATTEETFPAEGSFQIRVMNPSGNRSNALLEEVVDLGPSISTVMPASAIAGSSPVEVTFTGRNFRATSRLQVDGVDHSLEVVSESAAKTTLTATELATPGRRELRVVNDDGRRSNRRFFDALIVIDSIVPERMLKSSDVTITIMGGGFRAGAKAMLEETPLPTSMVSNIELRASIAASLIAVAGARSVIVRDANGIVSNSKTVRVHDTPPSITALSPSIVGGGAAGFPLQVTGEHFQDGASVQINGAKLPTVFLPADRLSAQVPDSAVTRSGSLSILVENPDGGISREARLTVSAQPLITRLNRSTLPVGGPAIVLQVTGLTFQPGAIVLLNDVPSITTYRRSTRVDVSIPASLRTASGTLRLRVLNPDGGRSNVATIEVRE